MNWDAIGAIAELLAATGVILSLVYLAKQIRSSSDIVEQNTIATLSSSESSSMAQSLEIMRLQIESPALSELARKGHRQITQLEPTEKHQYSLLLTAIFETHQTYFIQHARGSAGPEIWDYYTRVFDQLMSLPGVMGWWQHHQATFDPSFRTYINSKIETNT